MPAAPDAYRGLVSGSFNPLHEGHRRLREASARRLGGPVAFELPVFNADKPPLALPVLLARVEQFQHALALTSAPTFVEKARLFPGTVFVIGADTAVRVLEPRFYGDSQSRLDRALDEIQALGCRFLVAGRLEADRFVTSRQIAACGARAALFEELPESEFRVDVSSTRLRRG